MLKQPIKIYSLEGRQPAPTSGPSAPCAFTCGVPSPLSSSKSFSMSVLSILRRGDLADWVLVRLVGPS
ncbi:hypothetical protein O3P69_013533 [Scylla paramamosain]|uniref:Uncharacterized protein n=1 Tax=Scylla paramamosain TaxID=85552 RepID=A0AAW0SFY7_SCYPA